MFFDLMLLNRQHRGRFGLAWIAATRGVNYLNKNEVFEIDVGKLCEEIADFVCSESDSPRSRFSLRLSAILINGTVKIHKQKAIYFLDETMKFLMFVSVPHTVKLLGVVEARETFGTFETPPTPITKIKSKRRRLPVEKETPESQITQMVQQITAEEVEKFVAAPVIQEPIILQRRTEEITIRETQTQPMEMTGIADFGVLGTFQPGEEELAMLEEFGIQPLGLREKVVSPVRPPPRLEPVITEESPEQPSVTLTVQAQIHVSAQPEAVEKLRESPKVPSRRPEEVRGAEVHVDVPVEAPPPQEPMEIVEAPTVPSRRPVLKEIQVEERDRKTAEVRKVRKKKPDDLAKLLISATKPIGVARINRCEPDDLELVDLAHCPLPDFKLRMPNLTNLLNLYLVRDGRDLRERQISESSSLRYSATLTRKSGQLTPVELSEEERTLTRPPPVPEIREPLQLVPEVPEMLPVPMETQIPLMASTPLSRRGLEAEAMEIDQRTRGGIEAVEREIPIVSPRKKRKLLEREPEVLTEPEVSKEPEMPSRELAPSIEILPQETVVEAVPVPIMTEKDRQQRIVNKILQSDRARLTLMEICHRPINRLNVARTFNDLLVLCRHSYVKLISEDSGSELKFIEKGPKLIH